MRRKSITKANGDAPAMRQLQKDAKEGTHSAQMKELLQLPVCSLLSPRFTLSRLVCRDLPGAGIMTLGELAALSEPDLIELPRVGKKAAAVLQQELEALGLRLSPTRPAAKGNAASLDTSNPSIYALVRSVCSVWSYPCSTMPNMLFSHGLRYVFQVAAKSEAELLRIYGFGNSRLRDVRDGLGSMGLSLGMRIDGDSLRFLERMARQQELLFLATRLGECDLEVVRNHVAPALPDMPHVLDVVLAGEDSLSCRVRPSYLNDLDAHLMRNGVCLGMALDEETVSEVRQRIALKNVLDAESLLKSLNELGAARAVAGLPGGREMAVDLHVEGGDLKVMFTIALDAMRMAGGVSWEEFNRRLNELYDKIKRNL